MHLLPFLLATLATAHSVDRRPAKGEAGGIFPRDLPDCPPCDGEQGPYYWDAADKCGQLNPDMVADAAQAYQWTYPAGYWPQICDEPTVNCVTAMPGTKWTEVGGLSAPLGRWTIEGGSEIIAWCYWQSTLQWVGPGGSGTTYNAHCTIWACAEGKMRVDVSPGGTVMGEGVGNNDDPNKCQCFSNLDADITFSLHD